ncbi:[protein-PII] uridylyltransferase [Candidatus Thiothrix sp. Deng01]|uniref:Bifunctional uridylyltransferase/uridylyl-removing enzyme n=1 Tax=Candidatus Thiothrix phosphatis TaxID=3112415 RepID=A0ABU6D0I7_9GAMM|nr:[protein-PII] uridylyltransferase [Candidatus Thiothrix sp. Deng01]MEB4591874.1 [protein-PII] uridylyltransferase [Candidatus Thiothrix sp. Deng01]
MIPNNPLLEVYNDLLERNDLQVADYSQAIREARKRLGAEFHAGQDIRTLLYQHTQFIDALLQHLWNLNDISRQQRATLVAVGGYGRQELHPASDIDVMILLTTAPSETCREHLSAFITLLWDIGLDVGHSVRTLEECVETACGDLTVITNLIEARFLGGNETLFFALRNATNPASMWNSREYFQAKLEELQKRHQKYGDTSHRVEPNLKDGRGGLRDIQTISWVTQREYGTFSLQELYENHLLEHDEYETLREGRLFLWRIRFVLHELAGRKEDRLLFDYQRSLAHTFGYTDDTHNVGVEAFMQRYYRTITELERLTDMLMGIFRERILTLHPPPPEMLGEWYQKRGNLISVLSPDVFVLYPTALLEIFLLLQMTPGVNGLTSGTIRLIRRNLHRIDASFRQQARHRQLFMQILRQPKGITFVMRLMNRYGILAAYIPVFANIVGRMQYDLFHMYTVDEHTLYVVRNLRRYSTSLGAQELPLCAEVFKTLRNPELLYLAGLFHDIAKGRRGDHSELGAADAYSFCREHSLNLHDASLVSWLVRNHLLMSMTAQRKDISDPDVIFEFAGHVASQSRLDCLFLLTVADIRGTNPKLWNGWKQALLHELYHSTRRVLQNRTLHSRESALLIEEKRRAALEQLVQEDFTEAECLNLWGQFGTDYHLQHSVETVLWHTRHILTEAPRKPTLIHIRHTVSRSSNVLFVYTKDRDDLFSRVVSSLEQLNLNVVQARFVSTTTSFNLYTLHILGPDNQLIISDIDQQHIIDTLAENLAREKPRHAVHRTPRILRNFDVPTRVSFNQQPEKNLTLLEINAGDMPGLLSRMGNAMDKLGIRVHNARINTLGEQAQDIFYVTTRDGTMITQEAQQKHIRKVLEQTLKGG